MSRVTTNMSSLSEAMLTEILARLPLRSICRFKTVCKTWKSTFESAYFRRLFLFAHRNSSSSWSLMHRGQELIMFYGCKTWDLPKSLTSFTPSFFQLYPPFSRLYLKAYTNGLVLIASRRNKAFYYVGSPILQQWVRIPPPPHTLGLLGLVTHSDKDGVVLSFKVFSFAAWKLLNGFVSQTWDLFVYSSETGIWTSKKLHCPHVITDNSYITLNGTIYFSFLSKSGRLAAYDLYSNSDQFRVVHFPDDTSEIGSNLQRALTTSGDFVMYIKTLAHSEKTVLKVWRLDSETWQVLWEISLARIGYNTPMTLHPFDSGIVYLWSQENHHVVSYNLRTQKYRTLADGYNDDHQDFFIDQSVCDKSMGKLWGSGSLEYQNSFRVSSWLSPFVLPRWMEPMPRPPQGEIIDTASLLSHLTLMQERKI